jgi:DNA-binding NarL/FixJ family response regulator
MHGRHRGHRDDHRGARGRPRAVVLTTFDDDDYVYAALRARASGFLVKDMALDYIFARRFVAQIAGRPESPAPRREIDGITERERQVLTW